MMKTVHLANLLILWLMLNLAACGGAAPPPVAAPPTPTVVSYLTQPQPAAAAPTPAPTFTSTPSPAPSPTNTAVLEAELPPTDTPMPATPTAAPSPEPVEPTVRLGEAAANRINVRSGPSTDYPVVSQLGPGQEAAVTGRAADGSWWQVKLADETVGWVFGELVTFSGDSEAIAVAEAPPPPPTATPAPAAQAEAQPQAPPEGDDDDDGAEGQTPAELVDELRCGKDFCVTYQAMVPIWENGGCIGNHSIFVTVLQGPPPGQPLDGIVIGDTFNNIEVASGDKGPGLAEVTLWMNSMSLKVKRHIGGAPYTSEESFSFTSHDELIPAEVLAANGYCEGNVEKCRIAQQSNQVCRGHYSWKVTFHKFD
jgi:hypothetical protein